MKTNMLPFDKVTLTDGFWKERQELNRRVTIWNVYKRFKETGRFDAFKMNWKEGEPNKPHYFWDSDVAKWLEAAAYLTLEKREPELEAIVDEVVDDIERGRMEDGYFNIYYQLFAADKRFTERGHHELYCAGHLLEAAIAYDHATGKGKLLAMMKDYMRLIKKAFVTEKWAKFDSPGHEEIELALIKLYDYTGETEWLELAAHFLNARGSQAMLKEGDNYHRGTNIQDHAPIREQTTAEGHAVRACYLYSAMADLAERTDDAALKATCEAIFSNIINEKMYITGSVGSTHVAEAFEDSYRLPNDTAYAETCATLALALFARRMERMDADSRYADTVERVIYNGFLSGMSLDGKSFFYVNSQEIDLENRRIVRAALHENRNMNFPITQRVEVFGCSCCPPNITRFIASIGDFVFSYTDDTILVNQYMGAEAEIGGTKVEMLTDFPAGGTVVLRIGGEKKKLALRIPGWCKAWTLTKNGSYVRPEVEKGYAYIDAADGDELRLELAMEIRHVRANHKVRADRGMRAVTYGPLVYCMEGVDNGGELGSVVLKPGEVTSGWDETLGVMVLYHPAARVEVDGLYSDAVTEKPFTARMIPYFAFANRGETDMRIWIAME